VVDVPIQILVNNAGVHDDAVFPACAPSNGTACDVSLNGFFHVTQPLTLPMIRSRWGRIINITSIAGLVGNRGPGQLCRRQGRAARRHKSLSLELASRGITVNAVAPGIIQTGMIEGVFDDKAIAGMVPMKRAGKPEEVADLVGFLARNRPATSADRSSR